MTIQGEKIVELERKDDSGVQFLVTFVLPLFQDEVNTLRGFLVFAVLLLLIIILLVKSDRFYQNPVLAILGYKVFEFKFEDTLKYKDVRSDRTYIGITKGTMVSETKIIKRKRISDGVFLVFQG